MSEVLIFGGTSEGRKIAEILAENKIPCDLCVATEYGGQVAENSRPIKENLQLIHIKTGRLNKNQMKKLAQSENYTAVIDATHPFAAEVTKNIRESFLEKSKIIRIERNLKSWAENNRAKEKNLEYFAGPQACENALEEFIKKNPDARILLTTGSKDLHIFCRNENLKKNLVARVLPSAESIKICAENALEGKQIIAMQGPFSQKMNETQIQDFKIKILVAKESGRAGGTDEKIEAAKNCGIKCFIIKKTPQISEKDEKSSLDSDLKSENYIKTNSLKEACEKLGEILNQKIKACCHLKIFLCGSGMGNPENLTKEAENAIENADFIFGAPRMIQNAGFSAQKFPFYIAKDIIPVLEKIQNENAGEISAAVLFSGDTGFFSGAAKLYTALKNLKDCEIKILPGISSLSYLSSKIGISYENAKIISAHGTDEKIWKNELTNALNFSSEKNKIFFLTSNEEDAKKIVQTTRSVENNRHLDKKFKIILGFNLSYQNEKILILSSGECEKIQEKGLCCGFILQN